MAVQVRAMMMPFPFNAEPIALKWRAKQGGFGVMAWTDMAGLPVIGLNPLNPDGQSMGKPIEYAHDRLRQRLVIGRDEQRRVIMVLANILVDHRGLALRVAVPQHMLDLSYDRYLSVPWNRT
jgi:hypothetical protein